MNHRLTMVQPSHPAMLMSSVLVPRTNAGGRHRLQWQEKRVCFIKLDFCGRERLWWMVNMIIDAFAYSQLKLLKRFRARAHEHMVAVRKRS